MNILFYILGPLFFIIFIIPLFKKYLTQKNPINTSIFYLLTIGGFLAYFISDSELIRYIFFFISLPAVVFIIFGMLKNGSADKKNKLQEFQETVYLEAFPGGPKQIDFEVSLLEEKMGEGFSKEKIKSLLLRATTKFYFKMLGSTSYDHENFIIEFSKSENISDKQAMKIYKLVLMKYADSSKEKANTSSKASKMD